MVYIAKIFWISVAYILLSSKKSLWQSEKNEKKWRFLTETNNTYQDIVINKGKVSKMMLEGMFEMGNSQGYD